MRAKLLKDAAELSAGTELEVVDSYCGVGGFYYICELPKGNQIAISSNLVEITDYSPYINWEQRRYEIAKAVMQGMCARRMDVSDIKYEREYMANYAVAYADALIEELKK